MLTGLASVPPQCDGASRRSSGNSRYASSRREYETPALLPRRPACIHEDATAAVQDCPGDLTEASHYNAVQSAI